MKDSQIGGLMLLAIGLGGAALVFWYWRGGWTLGTAMDLGLPLGLIIGGLIFTFISSKPSGEVHGRSTMKKCVKCGRDIMVISEKCQYCGANQITDGEGVKK